MFLTIIAHAIAPFHRIFSECLYYAPSTCEPQLLATMVEAAVRRLGALDVLKKPIRRQELVARTAKVVGG